MDVKRARVAAVLGTAVLVGGVSAVAMGQSRGGSSPDPIQTTGITMRSPSASPEVEESLEAESPEMEAHTSNGR